ncbi:MAG: hypothetical protein M3083_11230 [Actinomycetota bacterium]|nr:hypothetical protein [Actinomycetota bacterium]
MIVEVAVPIVLVFNLGHTSLFDEDGCLVAVNTWRRGDPPVLGGIDRASLYFGGHDDCYFYVESRTPRLPRLILCRLLALLVGAALIRDKDVVEIPEPSEDFAAALLSRNHAWVGVASTPERDEVRIELTPMGWHLGQPIPYDPIQTAILNLAAREWTLRPT